MGDGHTRRGERVGVGGELQQGLDLDRPGQLRVAQSVPFAVEHQEVGEADEPAVEHRGLIDHRRATLDRAHRLFGGGGQSGDGVVRSADDRDGVIGELAKLVEVTLFVLPAEFGCPREQFVLDRDPRSPAELRVE